MLFAFIADRLYVGPNRWEIGPMKIDANPLFRRVITPWYDSNAACWIVLIFLVAVILFSVAGIVVARSQPDYYPHTWLPVTLLALSASVAGSVAFRLIKRRYEQQVQSREF